MGMNRRELFRAGAAVAAATAIPALTAMSAPRQGPVTRISSDKDDAGYTAYCKQVGDGMCVIVHLDGIEQRNCVTADSSEGFVKRWVETDNGNIAHDGQNILLETVRGRVVIDVTPWQRDVAIVGLT